MENNLKIILMKKVLDIILKNSKKKERNSLDVWIVVQNNNKYLKEIIKHPAYNNYNCLNLLSQIKNK
jgi:hypothetical protein